MNKRKPIIDASDSTIAPPRWPTMAGSDAAGAVSPAHLLHRRLELSLATEPYVEKWPVPVRAAILVGAAVLTWSALLYLVL